MTSRSEPAPTPTTPLVELVIADGIDRQSLVRLQDLLTEAMSLRPTQLVLDLTQCTGLDAAAVDLLLDTHRRMWHLGGRLILRSPSPHLQRIFRLARVDHVFDVVHGAGPQRPPDRRTRGPLAREGSQRP
jgi:anti-anti-sigma factor